MQSFFISVDHYYCSAPDDNLSSHPQRFHDDPPWNLGPQMRMWRESNYLAKLAVRTVAYYFYDAR